MELTPRLCFIIFPFCVVLCVFSTLLQDYQGVWLRHYVPVDRRSNHQQSLFGPIPKSNEEKRQLRGTYNC